MKNNKWVGLISLALLPFYPGCAQSQNRYPTTVVQSGAPYQAPANTAAPYAADPGAPPAPDQNAVSAQSLAQEPQSPAGAPANVSPAAAEMIKMAESGVSEDVLVAYAQKSPTRYELSADTILYLKDLGLTSTVITAMVNRDGSLKNEPLAQAPAPQPQYQQPPPQQTGPPPGQPGAPGPAVETAQPTYVSNPPEDVNYFYENLSPYGTWVVLDGVGWCWQPRAVVVDRGWSPYCNSGHWVYTDCGWFWQSDYSWGWAPFHYGRWYRHDRCGWVWTPDRTWGPAWVTWRVGGDDCGWAPLPPHAVFDAHLGWRFNGVRVGATFDFGLHPDHFTFVAVHDFNRHDFQRARFPVTQVRNVYNRTTIINNTTVVNNTIVNRGIASDRVAAATHTPIRKVAIREQTASSGRVTRDPGLARSGAVYREQVKAPAHPAKVQAQKLDDRHPVVQHTDIRQVTHTPSNSSGASRSSTGTQRSNPTAGQTTTRQGTRENTTSSGIRNTPQQSQRDVSQPRNNNNSANAQRERQPAQRELPAANTAPSQRQNVPTVTPSPFGSRGVREQQSSVPDRVQQPNSAVRQRDVTPRPVYNDNAAADSHSRIESRGEVPRQYLPKGASEGSIRSAPQVERHAPEARSESKVESRNDTRGDSHKGHD